MVREAELSTRYFGLLTCCEMIGLASLAYYPLVFTALYFFTYTFIAFTNLASLASCFMVLLVSPF